MGTTKNDPTTITADPGSDECSPIEAPDLVARYRTKYAAKRIARLQEQLLAGGPHALVVEEKHSTYLLQVQPPESLRHNVSGLVCARLEEGWYEEPDAVRALLAQADPWMLLCFLLDRADGEYERVELEPVGMWK